MNLKKSVDVHTYTAFLFGKEGSGYDHLALRMAEKGSILVLACAAVDGLVGKSIVDGNPLPLFDYADIGSVADFEAVMAELNKERASDKFWDTIILFGLAQFAAFVSTAVAPSGQPSQPQFGQIARDVMNYIRQLRGYAKNLYVTCDIRADETSGEDRFNVQPAIYNAIAGELANAFFVTSKKDGTRLVQTDPLLALNLIPGGKVEEPEPAPSAEPAGEAAAEEKPKIRSRQKGS
jgi:hypothetical protein